MFPFGNDACIEALENYIDKELLTEDTDPQHITDIASPLLETLEFYHEDYYEEGE